MTSKLQGFFFLFLSGKTYGLDSPPKVLDQEWLNVPGLHATQLSGLDIIKKERRYGTGGRDEMRLLFMLSAVVTRFGRCGEDVCDTGEAREGGPVGP